MSMNCLLRSSIALESPSPPQSPCNKGSSCLSCEIQSDFECRNASEFRADYWKSNPRKECEFCKCWIADNRPSIEFHENGKRHKENVAKRLSEIGKKSAQDAKNKKQVDKDFKKMEEAAMKAYLKDIEENADFTSQLVLMEMEAKEKQREEELAKQAEMKKSEEAAKHKERQAAASKTKKALEKAAKVKWYEAKSDQGHSYYWHIESNETKWEPPEEGYLSKAEQKTIKEEEKRKAELKEMRRKEKEIEEKKRKLPTTSGVALKKKKTATDLKIPKSSVMGPAPRGNPYGSWKAVETEVQQPVDFQLPLQSSAGLKVPTLEDDRPKIKFHEKKLTLSMGKNDDDDGKSSFSGFKKISFRGNMRQRLDTDD